uniref:Uncharacterized protein n=1 Tax=Anopheles minimus TaxID=112268 RepID=A0A182WMU8_9DIPT
MGALRCRGPVDNILNIKLIHVAGRLHDKTYRRMDQTGQVKGISVALVCAPHNQTAISSRPSSSC